MAVDYARYLAEKVINEQKTITYRSLGFALKVHANLAKQMLYDFHHRENSRKPNTVNATYLITGLQRLSGSTSANGSHGKDGEDEIMQSSPMPPSSMPQLDDVEERLQTTSVTLVREEHFEEAKALFEHIYSIHVYSLQPTPLQDLNVLTHVDSETVAASAGEDPLEHGKQYGMIQNKNVKRRKGAQAPPPAPAKPVTAKVSDAPKQPVKKEESPPTRTGSEVSSKSAKPSSARSSQGKTSDKSAKKDVSSLFKSFAKAKPKPKPEEIPSATASGAESAEPSGQEDVVLDDESEEEREDLFLDTGKRTTNKPRETRKEREDRLKQMMEDDDEDMPDVSEPPADEPEPEPAKKAPSEERKPEETEPEPKEQVTVQGGRRRGRRQVMKKRTVKDEEGYLVTKEEAAWESFSEDDVEPPKKKQALPAAKSAKGGSKPGQGSIMSFFAKK